MGARMGRRARFKSRPTSVTVASCACRPSMQETSKNEANSAPGPSSPGQRLMAFFARSGPMFSITFRAPKRFVFGQIDTNTSTQTRSSSSSETDDGRAGQFIMCARPRRRATSGRLNAVAWLWAGLFQADCVRARPSSYSGGPMELGAGSWRAHERTGARAARGNKRTKDWEQ